MSFKGSFTSGLITTLLGFCEIRLDNFKVNLGLKKRIYSVLVEILQNLFHHHQQDHELDQLFGEHFGLFKWSEDESTFIFTTGNIIHKEKKEAVNQQIDKLNQMTRYEQKEFYKEVLNNQSFSEKGGGGLGLIDMAKKSDEKIQYAYYDLKDDFEFLIIKVFIHILK